MSKTNRREFLCHGSFLGLALATGLGSSARRARGQQVTASATTPHSSDLLTQPALRAVDRGLAFLTSRQQADGSLGSEKKSAEISALAGLAFLSAGSTRDRGRHRRQIDLSIDFVSLHADEAALSEANAQRASASLERSLLNPVQETALYGESFATLFLAECHETSRCCKIDEKLSAAVERIVDAQYMDGSWRREAEPTESDLVYTARQLLALRAVRNAGIQVPTDAIQRGADFIKRSQNSDGGFSWDPADHGEKNLARTAAALAGLYAAGIYEGAELERGLDHLTRFRPRIERGDTVPGEIPQLAGYYLATQAMWHAGGTRWETWYVSVRDLLLKNQAANGSWSDAVSSEHATSLACLILQMPNSYLPSFQR
ncbi:MAG: prenyltransferase/squalene oxidase repeat-containing protein [Planctomycetota bacterium]|nr:prenyltransferase/squalene oxidase repeat-containing protein [Planctomycetota bacterium]